MIVGSVASTEEKMWCLLVDSPELLETCEDVWRVVRK